MLLKWSTFGLGINVLTYLVIYLPFHLGELGTFVLRIQGYFGFLTGVYCTTWNDKEKKMDLQRWIISCIPVWESWLSPNLHQAMDYEAKCLSIVYGHDIKSSVITSNMLKFWSGQIISHHTIYWIWLLINDGIYVNLCLVKGVLSKLIIPGILC